MGSTGLGRGVGRGQRAGRVSLRVARRAGVAVGAAIAVWVALAVHPQLLFAAELRRANVVLHARDPLPPEAGPLLDEVVRRVSHSPLYDPARVHHVFLCDTPALFAFFAPWSRKVGGVAQWHLGGNVFIRPSSIARGRVIGPSGNETPGARTLAYFIAHEVTHAMTADRVGRWRYARLAAFQVEGYADFVAFDRTVDSRTVGLHQVDLAAGRAALRRGAPEMSPKLSGLYRRYELLVAYLFERRGFDVAALLARPLDRAQLERELLSDERI